MGVLRNMDMSMSHPDSRTLHQWVEKSLLDLFEGRGGIGAIDNYIQSLASVCETLASFGSISWERQQYFTLLKAIAPEGGTGTFIFKRRISQIEGRKAVHEAAKELRGMKLPLSEQIVGTHLAYKHYKSSALASLDALVMTYRWIGSLEGKDAVELAQSEDESKFLTHLALTLFGIRHGSGITALERNLLQAIGACAYALAHEKIKREDAHQLLSAAVEAMEWSHITTHFDPAGARISADATEHFRGKWARTFGVAVRFLLAHAFVTANKRS